MSVEQKSLGTLTKEKRFKYVYVISLLDLGLYKIGVTDNVPRRLSQLQAKSAYPLRIEHVYRVYEKAAILFESILHEAFGDCRTHGEWFRMTPDHVKVLDTEVPWVFSMKRVYRRSND